VLFIMLTDVADSFGPENPLVKICGHRQTDAMTKRPQNPALAIVLMLTATAFIAGTMLCAKLIGSGALGEPLHPLQISHGRFFFAFMALSTAAAVMRPKFGRPDMRIHIGRTLFGWGGVTCMFAAVAFIPLSDATAISFLNPVFGMLLAIPLLGERVGRWRWLAAFMAICGALILLRPGPDTFQVAALLALGAAVLMGMELIFIKKLADREPPFQILLVNNALGLCIATLAVLPVWVAPTGAQWVALAGLGVLMAMAQTCFVNAMARADASFVTPFSYIALIFASLYDLIIFDVWPDAISWIGAGVILSGAALLAWREGRLRPSVGTQSSSSASKSQPPERTPH
jgi:drug/metabolite transporter (DMT)-like permease